MTPSLSLPTAVVRPLCTTALFSSLLTLPALADTSEIGLLYQLNGSIIEARGFGEGIMQGFSQEPFVAGKVGSKALSCELGQYVALPSFYRGDQFTQLSVSLWVNTSNPGDQVLLSYDRDEYWELGINGDSAGEGQVAFGINTNDGVKNIASATRVDDGLWHHVVAIFDGGTGALQVYIDGALDNSATSPAATRFGSGTKRFGFVGASSDAAEINGDRGPDAWYVGTIDDIRVSGGAVSLAQVTEILNQDASTAADGARSLVDSDGDGLPSDWETANGLDPNDASDADGNADGDLGTNIQEFRAKTDPQTAGDYTPPPAKPVAEVLLVEGNAYELEGTPATFRITLSGGSGPAVPVFYSLGTSSDPGEGASDPSDYTVTDTADAPLSGFVLLSPNGGTADIRVNPVADTTAEFPEVVELSLDLNFEYTLGNTSAERCLINDATDTPDNVTTFKAIYDPERGAATTAIGFATLTLNGPKTEASFFSTFSGLTSPQSNAHIHHVAQSAPGVPDFGSGGPVIEQLPIGSDITHLWNIADSAGFSVKDLIDALFRQNGLSLYCNVHTNNFGGGEIWGFFEEFTGAIALSQEEIDFYEAPEPIPALSTEEDLKRDVARFLTQTTWGPRMSDIDALYNEIITNHDNGDGTFDQVAAYQEWMTDQLALDQTKLYDLIWALDEYEWYADRFYEGYTDADGPLTRTNYFNNYGPKERNFEGTMWTMFSYSHDQFRQRIALALSEIVVISRQDTIVRNFHLGAATYWDMLADAADGRTWKQLLRDVSRSPMMGNYLSHLKNETVKDNDGNIIVFPDENYAREIQQLFSIGLLDLLKDGRIRLGNDGQPVQTYTNVDIENLARVFTGWTFSQWETADGSVVVNVNSNPGNGEASNFNRANGNRWRNQLQWTSPMTNFRSRHDQDPKTYLGNAMAANRTGLQDLNQVLNILESHPGIAPFISRLLIKRMVTSNPSEAYVYRVASVFEGGTNHQSGSGLVDGGGSVGNIERVVRAVILDREARDLAIADSRPDSGKVREPALVLTHAIRGLNAQSRIKLDMLTRLGSGPNYVVTPGSGNTIDLPVTGEGPDWPAFDYQADQFDNFPPDASIIHITGTNPIFGQSPLSAPTVFNWFLPDFSPGGEISIAGLTAPELQIVTETQAVDRINYHDDLIRAPRYINGRNIPGFTNADDYARADFSEYIGVYDNAVGTAAEKAEILVDYLDLVFASGSLKRDFGSDVTGNNPRQYIIDAVTDTTESVNDKVINALYLVINSPSGLSQR